MVIDSRRSSMTYDRLRLWQEQNDKRSMNQIIVVFTVSGFTVVVADPVQYFVVPLQNPCRRDAGSSSATLIFFFGE
ncbi:hypothetical protein QTP88_022249 [Uroleucon formosanum]